MESNKDRSEMLHEPSDPVVTSGRRSKLTKAEINSQPDQVIAGFWQKLASFIMNNENMKWPEASDKARALMQSGDALEYVRKTKIKVGQMPKPDRESNESPPSPPEAVSKPPEKNETGVGKLVTGLKSPENHFQPLQPYTDNYYRLQKIIPDLEPQLAIQDLNHVSSIEGSDRLLDFKAEFLHQDDQGRYAVSLSHPDGIDEDNLPDLEMLVRIDLTKKTLEVITYREGQEPTKYVYSEMKGVTHTNHTLKKELNDFLAQWLNNLIVQGHEIKREEEVLIPVEETVEYWQQLHAEAERQIDRLLTEASEQHEELENIDQQRHDWERWFNEKCEEIRNLQEEHDEQKAWADKYQKKYENLINLFKPAYEALEGEPLVSNGDVYYVDSIEEFIGVIAHLFQIQDKQ